MMKIIIIFNIFIVFNKFTSCEKYGNQIFNCSMEMTGKRTVSRYSTIFYSGYLIPSKKCFLNYESFLFKLSFSNFLKNITLHTADISFNHSFKFDFNNIDILDIYVHVYGLGKTDQFFDYDNVLNLDLFEKYEGILLAYYNTNITILDTVNATFTINNKSLIDQNSLIFKNGEDIRFDALIFDTFENANITYHWNILNIDYTTGDSLFNYKFKDIGNYNVTFDFEIIIVSEVCKEKVIAKLHSIKSYVYIQVKEKIDNIIITKNPSVKRHNIFEIRISFSGSPPFICTLNGSLGNNSQDLHTIYTLNKNVLFLTIFDIVSLIQYIVCVSNEVSHVCHKLNITIEDYPLDARKAPFILIISCIFISIFCTVILFLLTRLSLTQHRIETANFDFHKNIKSADQRPFRKFGHRIIARTKQFVDKMKEKLRSKGNYELVQYSRPNCSGEESVEFCSA